MKSIVLNGISEMGMLSQQEPVLNEKMNVLVNISHVGVCGSDMHFYNKGRIGPNQVNYPFVLGHEGSGIVEKTGPGVEGLKKGQRIAIEPAMSCHKCDQCLAGRPHTCRNLSFMGNPGQSTGLLSERVAMPADSCYPLPDHINNELAVMAEPLSIAVWAGDLAGVLPEMSIGILGSGPIGLSVLKYCRYLGAKKIYSTDKLDYRLTMAADAGAVWTGNPDNSDIVSGIMAKEAGGLDLIFDCCGMQEAIDQAIQMIKPGGKIMIIGIPEFDSWKLPTDETRRKEICFQNVRRQNERMQKAIDLISENKIDMSTLITHRFRFEETEKAFDLVAGYRDGVMKAIIEY